MTFELSEILRSKQEYRQRLAARPVADKLRLLDQLRESGLDIAASRAQPERIESLLLEGRAAEPGELVTGEWWHRFDAEVFGHPIGEVGR